MLMQRFPTVKTKRTFVCLTLGLLCLTGMYFYAIAKRRKLDFEILMYHHFFVALQVPSRVLTTQLRRFPVREMEKT